MAYEMRKIKLSNFRYDQWHWELYRDINVHKLLLLQERLLWVQECIFSARKEYPTPEEGDKGKASNFLWWADLGSENRMCSLLWGRKQQAWKWCTESMGESHAIGTRRKAFSIGCSSWLVIYERPGEKYWAPKRFFKGLLFQLQNFVLWT